MSKRTALVPVLLVVGLIVAVIGATAALRLIGNGAFGPGGKTLSQADVRRSLAQASAGQAADGTRSGSVAPSAGPSPTAGTPGRPAGVSGSFPSSGGTVFATCDAGQATLTSWILNQGYGTDDSSRGPAPRASVTFKSASAEVTVTVGCKNNRPAFTVSADDRHGARGGRGG